LTFDLSTSGSVHAEVLPTLVMIAQAIFLLECRQTNRQTDATKCSMHACGYTANVGNQELETMSKMMLCHGWLTGRASDL